MTRVFNKTSEKVKRRNLRGQTPRAEAMVWRHLRNSQVEGFRFRRQYSVGPFVVDFYCPQVKLAIELDGLSHEGEEAGEYDHSRQAFIESFGIIFLRFQNEEVFRNPEGVVLKIAAICLERSKHESQLEDK